MSRADRWRPLALVLAVALAGAAASLLVGAASGMHRSALAHLAATLVPAAIVTVIAAAATRPFLMRAGVRSRLVALSLIATVTSLATLLVLAWLMFVDDHDTVVLAVLVLYSAAAGAGAAWVAARSTSTRSNGSPGPRERCPGATWMPEWARWTPNGSS
jgi:hypothetical protein